MLLHSTTLHRPSSSRTTRSLLKVFAVIALSLSTNSLPPLPTPTLKTHGFTNKANWLVPQKLLVGTSPLNTPSPNLTLQTILSQNITTFISLQSESPPEPSPHGYSQYLSSPNISYLHFKIEDFGVPETLEDLKTCVRKIHDREGKFYIHCFSGQGRTGLIASCLLSKYYRTTAAESLEYVQKCFDLRREFGEEQKEGRSPETEEQRDMVKRFYEEIDK
ncbi:hypothetical protein TrVE_jg5595 [Triparma verrucosa]|uniref:Tyrosine specific protein phosphatases domain-containing protein n=1 Tax=Triparma verrucosa TaxID=1606542 RepID=A0A9W7BDA7_9STRA|nr:hypothetical protein TrVE_jg5595 [Triparma verrucosa]